LEQFNNEIYVFDKYDNQVIKLNWKLISN
jgi:hypothetical protein